MPYRNKLKAIAYRVMPVVMAVVVACGGMLAIGVVNPQRASAESDTYQWSDATYVDANYDWGYTSCPSSDTGCMKMFGYKSGVKYGEADPWVYYLRNCTSFVAAKISQEFNGRDISGWGNAATWASHAQSAGYTLDASPQVGDIADWGTGVGGGFGHVAYVYAVSNGVGSLDEYNVAGTGQFSSNRTTAASSAGAADWYIHMGTPADATLHPRKSGLFWAYPSTASNGVDSNTLSSTGGSWTTAWGNTNWATPTQVLSGDFTGDGKTELLYLVPDGPGTVTATVVASSGSGWYNVWSVNGWTAPTALVAGNFDGVGKDDVLWAYPAPTGGGVNVNELYSTGSSWNLGWSAANWATPTQIVAGDFSGDNKTDLVYLTSAGSGSVNAAVLTSLGGSAGWATAWSVNGWTAPTALVAGNFDGVGKDDLFWVYPAPSGGGVNANTLFSTGSSWSTGWSVANWTTPSAVVAGDFDADGKSDLVYAMPSGPGTVNANTLLSNGTAWVGGWSANGWVAPTALVSGTFTAN